ncbi:TatD family deoxyribonuclease [Xylophilus rhododendri]|uniref:TatD family deoxyribonuclease n=1 Tax=Xylophilus rhododendri TaxID=2697032 RepID=A0A857J5I0_9BURK|nr:TatD family hydrolase [Xylophilus rhododendri]QHI98088.1 TatD family deoxyribonuclease [Xylophilus rhododendri]
MERWIDTHCHLDAAEFGADGDTMRQSARQRGVACCVVPAIGAVNFDAVQGWAQRHGDTYALGIHPLFTGSAGDDDLALLAARLEQSREDPQLVAIGEIGLDYFVPDLDDSRQQHFFREQLKLARRFDLPVLLHTRRSVDRVLRHLREVGGSGAGRHRWRGIAHAFNGSQQQADTFIALGFKLGVGGTATFDRAQQVRRVVQAVPLEAIVMETDAPDIPPHWLYRDAAQRADGSPQARNSPVELPAIGAAVAELRGLTPQALAEASSANAWDAMPRLASWMQSRASPV